MGASESVWKISWGMQIEASVTKLKLHEDCCSHKAVTDDSR